MGVRVSVLTLETRVTTTKVWAVEALRGPCEAIGSTYGPAEQGTTSAKPVATIERVSTAVGTR